MCARFPEIERSLSLNRAVVEPGSCGRFRRIVQKQFRHGFHPAAEVNNLFSVREKSVPDQADNNIFIRFPEPSWLLQLS